MKLRWHSTPCRWTDPRMLQNNHIPDFLCKWYLYRGVTALITERHHVKAKPDLTIKAQHLQLSTKKLMFEGRSNDHEPIRQLCMFNAEYRACDQTPFNMPGIDIVVGECTNFGAFKNATLVMTGKTHGIRLRIEDPQSSLHFMVPPRKFPAFLLASCPRGHSCSSQASGYSAEMPRNHPYT